MSGVHYDNPMRITYPFGSIDFAAAAFAGAISVPYPRGQFTRCRIEEIHVQVTEIFNAVTTAAFVRIGTGAVPARYAELDMNVAALTDGYGIGDDADPASVLKDISQGGFGVIDVSASGENITQLEVVTVQNTGGTPTGIGELSISLAWW